MTACPIMPWPGQLLSPWPPLLVQTFVLMSPVFTCPSDAKTAGGGWGWEGGGRIAVGVGGVSKALWRRSQARSPEACQASEGL